LVSAGTSETTLKPNKVKATEKTPSLNESMSLWLMFLALISIGKMYMAHWGIPRIWQ
jgi:hypothetical protein